MAGDVELQERLRAVGKEIRQDRWFIAECERMHRASGEQVSDDAVVCLLYLLGRDHLALGVLEAAVDAVARQLAEDPPAPAFRYTNGWLAQWAEFTRDRLLVTAEETETAATLATGTDTLLRRIGALEAGLDLALAELRRWQERLTNDLSSSTHGETIRQMGTLERNLAPLAVRDQEGW